MDKGKLFSLMREAFWVGFGLLFSIIALFLGTRFLTTFLPAHEYGKLSLSLSLTALAVQVFGNSIGQTLTRFYAHCREKGNVIVLIQYSAKAVGFAASVIFFICLLSIGIGKVIKGEDSLYFSLLTGLFAIFLVVNRVASGLEDAIRERRFRGIVQIFFEVTRFFFAVVLVVFLAKASAEIVLAGFLGSVVLTVAIHGVFFYIFFKKNFRGQHIFNNRLLPKETLLIKQFRAPLIISNCFMWMIMMSERWALLSYGTLTDVGGYAAVSQLSFMPMLFVSSFCVLLTEPIFYQKIGLNKQSQAASQMMNRNNYLALSLLTMTLIVFLLLFFFHHDLAYFLLGVEFRSYSWLFPWLSLAGGFFATSQQLLLRLSCEMRTSGLAFVWGVVALVAIFFYFLGAKVWQLKGILIAIVMVNSFLLILSIIQTRKIRENDYLNYEDNAHL